MFGGYQRFCFFFVLERWRHPERSLRCARERCGTRSSGEVRLWKPELVLCSTHPLADGLSVAQERDADELPSSADSATRAAAAAVRRKTVSSSRGRTRARPCRARARFPLYTI